MTVEEIKQQTPMSEVVRRYGIQIGRSGQCSCPFHGPDRHPSMKIYKDSYFCFTCHATGDVFRFIQEMDSVDFKTAFVMLGGTYNHEDKIANLKAWRAQKDREGKALRLWKLKKKRLDYINIMHIYMDSLRRATDADVFSDDWCKHMMMYEKYNNKISEVEKEIEGLRG